MNLCDPSYIENSRLIYAKPQVENFVQNGFTACADYFGWLDAAPCSLILDRDCKKDEEILFYYDWNESLEFESVSIQLAMECPDVDSSVDDMKLDVEEEITTATINSAFCNKTC